MSRQLSSSVYEVKTSIKAMIEREANQVIIAVALAVGDACFGLHVCLAGSADFPNAARGLTAVLRSTGFEISIAAFVIAGLAWLLLPARARERMEGAFIGTFTIAFAGGFVSAIKAATGN